MLTATMRRRHAAALSLVAPVMALLFGGLLLLLGDWGAFNGTGINAINRTLNQLMAVVMTCFALIIPLTANLYTPRLVKLYVAHPIIIGGMSAFMLGHGLTLALASTPSNGTAHRILAILTTALFLVILATALPYFYVISQFLRPSYFLPMLTRKSMHLLQRLGQGKAGPHATREVFETVDVLANVAITGVGRGDRQLVLLAMQSLHTVLLELAGAPLHQHQDWRQHSPCFLPGLAEEGQRFLTQATLWPEAYVLGQMLKILETAGPRQQEILAEVAGRLVESAGLSLVLGRPRVAELHVMVMNSLLRGAVEQKDLRRFQSLSYHYRLLVEAFAADPTTMLDAAAHLIHYGHLARRQGLAFGLETVAYDLGEMVLSLGARDEALAVELVHAHAGPLWQDALAGESLMRKVGWRTVLRLYWEAKVLGLDQLVQALFWLFLSDEAIHREQLELVLEENREMHYEFNDRLMRFASLSEGAVMEAQLFLESW